MIVFISMKNILNFMLLLGLMAPVPPLNANIQGQGFGAYEIAPFNISGNVNIAIPFATNKATTFTYYYQVINAKSQIIFTSGVIVETLLINSIYMITYSAKSGVTSLGQNTMVIRWRTSQTGVDAHHFVYFYGYEGSRVVDLNSASQLATFLNEEVTFRYLGYPETSGEKIKTTLEAPVLSGNAHFSHDLYFDFSALDFTTNRNYGARLYDSATLYTKDLSVFPGLSRLGDETVIPLKLSEAAGQISFLPNFSLYVDKKTYVVVQYAYQGYVVAKRLYFPKAKLGGLNLVKFRLQIKGYGYLKATLNLDFYLEIGATFLGQGGIHEAQIERN